MLVRLWSLTRGLLQRRPLRSHNSTTTSGQIVPVLACAERWSLDVGRFLHRSGISTRRSGRGRA